MLYNNCLNSLFVFSLIFILSFCGTPSEKATNDNSSAKEKTATISAPDFNSDSAFYFVERQVDFGPRVPNTPEHRKCADYLSTTLDRFTDTVYVQEALVTAYDGTRLNIQNIVGSFNPDNRNRILLAAHWDTRPYADEDPDPENHYTPIDGANDGASGVGVLLEIARQLSKTPIETGIDIILFDAEDYGIHSGLNESKPETWALGSRYWAQNPHIPNYYARFGILLDMVGAPQATFKQEGYSMYYAPNIVRRVWQTAQRAGYGNYFLNQKAGYVMDDHYNINVYRNIPTINIIHQDDSTNHGFFEYWHSTNDKIDHIDKNTLKAVGQTVLNVIFEN